MRIARLAVPPTYGVRYATLESDSEAVLWSDAPWQGGVPLGDPVAWDASMLRVPSTPTKILCVGRNYAAHAKELGHEVPKEPLLFLKPPSSLLDPGGTIALPRQSKRVEHEAELAVVIGRRAKDVREENALAHVFGYTCAGDVTARDLQKSDGQWSRAKGFDGFCPLGPWIETELDASHVRIRCTVGDATRQDGTTEHMIFSIPALIAYASAAMTLEPGDVLLTGTPEGVGPLVAGDRMTIAIEGIGSLTCDVRG